MDIPELWLLLLLPLLDRAAVGVVTERDVLLLTDPSVAVTIMTVVKVLGVGVAVVAAADVAPEEGVGDVVASAPAEVGD